MPKFVVSSQVPTQFTPAAAFRGDNEVIFLAAGKVIRAYSLLTGIDEVLKWQGL